MVDRKYLPVRTVQPDATRILTANHKTASEIFSEFETGRDAEGARRYA